MKPQTHDSSPTGPSPDKRERKLIEYSFWAGLLISLVLLLVSCGSLIRFMYLADSSIDKFVGQKDGLEEFKKQQDKKFNELQKRQGDSIKVEADQEVAIKRIEDVLSKIKAETSGKKPPEDPKAELENLRRDLKGLQEKVDRYHSPGLPLGSGFNASNAGSGANYTSSPDPTSVLITGRLAAATIAFNSCGLLLGISFAFLGFSLFLVGIKGEMDVSSEQQGVRFTITRMSPGALTILCAALIIWASLKSTPDLNLGSQKPSTSVATRI